MNYAEEFDKAKEKIIILEKKIENSDKEKEKLKQEFSHLCKERDKLIKENVKLKNAVISKFLNIDFEEEDI